MDIGGGATEMKNKLKIWHQYHTDKDEWPWSFTEYATTKSAKEFINEVFLAGGIWTNDYKVFVPWHRISQIEVLPDDYEI